MPGCNLESAARSPRYSCNSELPRLLQGSKICPGSGCRRHKSPGRRSTGSRRSSHHRLRKQKQDTMNNEQALQEIKCLKVKTLYSRWVSQFSMLVEEIYPLGGSTFVNTADNPSEKCPQENVDIPYPPSSWHAKFYISHPAPPAIAAPISFFL